MPIGISSQRSPIAGYARPCLPCAPGALYSTSPAIGLRALPTSVPASAGRAPRPFLRTREGHLIAMPYLRIPFLRKRVPRLVIDRFAPHRGIAREHLLVAFAETERAPSSRLLRNVVSRRGPNRIAAHCRCEIATPDLVRFDAGDLAYRTTNNGLGLLVRGNHVHVIRSAARRGPYDATDHLRQLDRILLTTAFRVPPSGTHVWPASFPIRQSTADRSCLYRTTRSGTHLQPAVSRNAGKTLVSPSASSPVLDQVRDRIAFSAARSGPQQVCLLEGAKRRFRQLTFLDEACKVLAWAPDGRIVFSSSSGSAFRQNPYGWLVDPSNGRVKRIATAPMATFCPAENGKSVTSPPAVDPKTWRGYRGGARGEIQLHDGAGHARLLRPIAGNIATPIVCRSRIYFIAEEDGQSNLFSCDFEEEEARARKHSIAISPCTRHRPTDAVLSTAAAATSSYSIPVFPALFQFPSASPNPQQAARPSMQRPRIACAALLTRPTQTVAYHLRLRARTRIHHRPRQLGTPKHRRLLRSRSIPAGQPDPDRNPRNAIGLTRDTGRRKNRTFDPRGTHRSRCSLSIHGRRCQRPA